MRMEIKAVSDRDRDYKKEYERRKKLAKKRGLTTAQARGHARKQEVPISQLKSQGLLVTPNVSAEKRYYKTLKAVNAGKSLTAAAKSARISPATVRKVDKTREALQRDPATGKYRVRASSEFDIVTKDGKLLMGVPLDKANSSLLGHYWNDVQKGLNGTDPKALRRYRGKVVYDIAGNQYRLLADVNDLRSIFDQMSQGEIDNFEEKFYRSLRHAA
jgi:hypothetical protein